MSNKNNVKYIIFGASGDLSKRYLLPALRAIEMDAVHISRKDYTNLKNLIPKDSEKIFHLAIPPEGVPEAIELISKNFGRENIKILLEKPFGKDLYSAQSLVEHIVKYFREDQIYRVDHYLAKKSLQNATKDIRSPQDIESIEIIASEKIGIEGRVNFYEQTGALRDFVQSHLLSMAGIVLSGSFEPEERYEALKDLSIVCDITKHECVKRGQYEGYKKEVGDPDSKTETFVSVNLVSGSTPVNLITGKALSEKLTRITINTKQGVEQVFNIEQESDAYERVIKAAILGEHVLFISSGEVLERWRILDDIQQTWKNSTDDLIIYPKGTDIKLI